MSILLAKRANFRHLLRSAHILVPALTFPASLHVQRASIRHFSATKGPLLMPYESFRNRGLLRSMLSITPAPIKTFGIITGITFLIFFTTPLLLILTPPTAITAYLLFQRYKRKERQLFDQRWSNMGSYHLAYDSNIMTDQSPPTSVKNSIFAAIEDNEQGIRDRLHVPDASTLGFTSVESIFQDFRASPSGLEESMQVLTYGLVEKHRGTRLAKVCVVVTGDSQKKMRVELSIGSKMYVLDGSTADDNVIEVKAIKDDA